jgi:HEAT repeat protein
VQSSLEEVVQATLQVEHAAQHASAESSELESKPLARRTWVSSRAAVIFYFVIVTAVIVLLAWGAHGVVKELLSRAARPSNENANVVAHVSTEAARQKEAEGLLERLATGDAAAANRVLEQSDGWTGKTEATPKTDQLITTSLNLNDLHTRAAALQAQLALNGIPHDASGFAMLERAAGNPQQRAFAMWMLGALGNRGVDPAHAAKIIEAYLNDPDVSVRSNVVIGLALLGTDETIPVLLDRFRSDPSLAVQELAGCGLAESGMYTQTQRMVVAATLVGWLNDSLLSQQQRIWTVQALHDISGQNYGTDSAAWQRWYESTR